MSSIVLKNTMKNKGRLLLTFFSVCLMFFILTGVAYSPTKVYAIDYSGTLASGTSIDGTYSWILESSGKLYVTFKADNKKLSEQSARLWNNYSEKITSVVIRNNGTVNTLKLNYMFSELPNLTEVTFDSSVDNVNFQLSRAFQGCEKLKKVTNLPKKIELMAYAFSGCTALEDMGAIIPYDGTTSYLTNAMYAFDGCESLKNITFFVGSSIEFLTTGVSNGLEYMFKGCKNLRANIIVDKDLYDNKNNVYNVDCIGMFNGAAIMEGSYIVIYRTTDAAHVSGLLNKDGLEGGAANIAGVTKSTNISSSSTLIPLSTIGTNVRVLESSNDKSLVAIYSFLTSNKTVADDDKTHPILRICGEGLFKSSTLPNAKSYDNNVCYATNTKKVVFDPGITVLPSGMFKSYTCLEDVSFMKGSKLTLIGESTFSGCTNTNFTEITLPTTVTTISKQAFADCKNLKTINGLGDLTTGATCSITSIGEDAFARTAISDFVLNARNANLSYKLFTGCKKLATINLNVKSIRNILDGNTDTERLQIETLVLGDDVESIGTGTFKKIGISTLKIPSSVNEIMNQAFADCTRLGDISIAARKVTGSKIFGSTTGTDLAENATQKTQNDEECLKLKLEATVTEIGDNAFDGLSIQDITIPSSVTSMGSNVFANCSELTSVNIESTVLGDTAFANCTNITSVELGNQLKIIPANTFIGTVENGINTGIGITELVIPSSVTEIGANAFANCSELKTLTIYGTTTGDSTAFSGCTAIEKLNLGDKLETIAKSAFAGCGITELTIPETVTTIGASAFADCTALKNLTVNSVTLGDGTAFNGCIALTSVDLGEKLTSIPANTFKDRGLTSIEIPASVTSIGANAFANCSELTMIKIPGNVTSIGANAFANCEALTNLTVNSVTLGDGTAFNGCTALAIVDLGSELTTIPDNVFKGIAISSIEIPASVKSIGTCAFANCEKLSMITIPENVSTIGTSAFGNCVALTKVTVNSATLGDGTAFNGCTAITTVDFGEKLTSIPANAFSGTALSSITIPASLKSIGANAFANCEKLTKITMSDDVAGVGNVNDKDVSSASLVIAEKAFSGCSSLTAVVLSNVKTLGNNVFENTNILSADLGVEEIGQHIFGDMSNYDGKDSFALNLRDTKKISDEAFEGLPIGSVVIPESVTSLGKGIFKNCKRLVSAEIYSKIISESMFENCNNLSRTSVSDEVVDVDEGDDDSTTDLTDKPTTDKIIDKLHGLSLETVNDIGNRAFYGCISLNNVIFSEQPIKIGESAFEGSGIHFATLSLSISSIGKRAFANCNNLETITLCISKISNEMFSDCNKLTKVELSKEVLEIGENAFLGCSKLSSANIDMESIPNASFKNITSLKEIKLNEDVTSIGDEAFSGTGIGDIVIPSNVTTVGNNIFANCLSLSSVTIDNSVIGNGMFEKCTELSKITINGNITSVGTEPFKDDSNLQSVILGCEKVKESLFKGYSSITSLSFDEDATVKEIGSDAFNGTGLTKVKLPDTIEKIGTGAFANCSSLRDLNISSGVVASGAFSGCVQLADSSKTIIDENGEEEELAEGSLTIGSVTLEDGAFNGCNNISNVTISAKEIPDELFKGISTLKSVTLEDGVEKIGKDAFNGTSIEEISIPSSVVSIGSGAFANCDNLKSADIASTVIGDAMFEGDTALEEVTITTDGSETPLTSIGSKAFAGTSISELLIPDGVTTIGDGAFDGCSKLTTINIPETVTSIGNNAFNECSSLGELYIGSNVTEFGEDVFKGCGESFKLICENGSKAEEYSKENNLSARYVCGIAAKYDGQVVVGTEPSLDCIKLYYVYSDDTIGLPEDDPYFELGYYEENEFEYIPELLKVTLPEVISLNQKNTATLNYNGMSCQFDIPCIPASIVKIEAEYNGDGVVEGLEVPVNDIVVTATYNNGFVDELKDWVFENEYTILADKTNTLNIVYSGEDADDYYETPGLIRCTVTVPGLAKHVVDFKATYTGTVVEYSLPEKSKFDVKVKYDNSNKWFSTTKFEYNTDEQLLPGTRDVIVTYTGTDALDEQFSTTLKLDVVDMEVKLGKYAKKMVITDPNSKDKPTQKVSLVCNSTLGIYKYNQQWVSSNLNVASVDNNGVVTALSCGKATISVKVKNTVLKFKLTVVTPSTSIKLNQKALTLMKGKSTTLKTTLYPKVTSDKVKWSTSNKKVATVSAKGKVKAVGRGTCTITAKTTSGKTYKCKVTVKILPNMIKLNKTKVTLKRGKSTKLKYKLPTGSSATVKWSTSNKKIATVDKKGNVKAKNKGKCTIKVRTSNGKTSICTVIVK